MNQVATPLPMAKLYWGSNTIYIYVYMLFMKKILHSFVLMYRPKAREGGVAYWLKISMHFRPFFSVIGGDGSEVGYVFCVHFFMSWIHKILNIGLYKWNLETTFTFPKVISLSRRNLQLNIYCSCIAMVLGNRENIKNTIIHIKFAWHCPVKFVMLQNVNSELSRLTPDWPHKGKLL